LTKCNYCQRTVFVVPITNEGDTDLLPAFVHTPGSTVCMPCNGIGSGEASDYDVQSVTIQYPPDDDGRPGDWVEVVLSRSHPLGSGKPNTVDLEFHCGTANVEFPAMGGEMIDSLRRFLEGYADRMRRFP
jgi:hypothetical protein